MLLPERAWSSSPLAAFPGLDDCCMVENEGVDLGLDASVEDIGENFDKITDLTGAAPRGMLQLGG